jgi:hypothetical protein
LKESQGSQGEKRGKKSQSGERGYRIRAKGVVQNKGSTHFSVLEMGIFAAPEVCGTVGHGHTPFLPPLRPLLYLS